MKCASIPGTIAFYSSLLFNPIIYIRSQVSRYTQFNPNYSIIMSCAITLCIICIIYQILNIATSISCEAARVTTGIWLLLWCCLYHVAFIPVALLDIATVSMRKSWSHYFSCNIIRFLCITVNYWLNYWNISTNV
jgi:hypothetical protein